MIYKSKKKQGLIEMIKAVKNTRNKLALFLLDDKNYSDKLYNIIIQAKKQNKKICYICFTKPYADVIDNFNRERINSKDFIFVDVLSSLNYPLKPIKNCIFVPGPQNLGGIKKAIKMHCSNFWHDFNTIDISTTWFYNKIHTRALNREIPERD